jgi:hypothetical protein
VVAYSSYASKPPPNSEFGRVATAVNPLGSPVAPGLQVLCVNPASPSGGTALLDPYFPALTLAFLQPHARLVPTPWAAFPGEYTARCESSGGATWLQVTRAHRTSAPLPDLTRGQGGTMGLHVFDVNLALGNLVSLAGSEASAYHG